MADTKLSSLSAGAAVSAADLFYAVQSAGVGGVKVTGTQIATFLLSAANTWTAAQTINLNAAAAPTPAAGTILQVVGADATIARVEADAFGAIAAFSIRRAEGTGAAPTALTSGIQIGAFNAHGYYVTGGPGWSGPQASLQALTTQAWTSTNQGTKLTLSTTPNNSTTLTTAVTIDQDQSVTAISFGLSGNISAPAWTTNGVRYKNVAATLTDTTSSGTVATAYTDVWGGNTIAASSATTFTQYYGAYFKVPVVGTNVTFTNKSALGADSISIGGAAQGTNALAVTGTSNLAGVLTLAGTAASGTLSSDNNNNGVIINGGNFWFSSNVGTPAYRLMFRSDGGIGWAPNSGVVAAPDTALTRGGPATIQLGVGDVASPIAQTMQVQSVVAGTAATAGVDWTFVGSKPTGASAGGAIVFKTAPAGGSGTAQTAAAEVLRLLAAGNVKFTNAANFSANGAVATSVTSVGPTGAQTTVQEWLTIQNAGGTTRYIPCF